MNSMSKSFKNEDGSEETLLINSDDNYTLKLDKSYKFANHTEKKENKLVKKFKGSILGADIGVKSGGFSNVAILLVLLSFSFPWIWSIFPFKDVIPTIDSHMLKGFVLFK